MNKSLHLKTVHNRLLMIFIIKASIYYRVVKGIVQYACHINIMIPVICPYQFPHYSRIGNKLQLPCLDYLIKLYIHGGRFVIHQLHIHNSVLQHHIRPVDLTCKGHLHSIFQYIVISRVLDPVRIKGFLDHNRLHASKLYLTLKHLHGS